MKCKVAARLLPPVQELIPLKALPTCILLAFLAN
jgi:hypothetical protein